MKKKMIWLVLLLSLVATWVYALTVTQIVNNTVVYLKKLIFTDNGTNNGNQKIVIDGTNGSITMSGALNIQQGALKDNTITTNNLVDGAVTNSKLANNSIDSSKIKNGSIKKEDLDPNIKMWMFKKKGTNAYYNAWNVWIWTDNPKKRLDVEVNWTATDSRIAIFENKNTASNANANIVLKTSWWRRWGIMFKGKHRGANDPFDFDMTYNFFKKELFFIDWQDNVNKPRMVITHDWKVWIWTVNPETTLDIMDVVPQELHKPHTTLAIRNTKLWWSAVVALQWWNWNDSIKFFGAEWDINDPNNRNKFTIRYKGGDKKFYMWYANNKNITVTSDGKLWIWTTNPQYKLDVNGDVLANQYNVRSDRRFKKDIKELTGSLEKILKLKWDSYIFKSTWRHDIWLIAQEVQKVYPNLVHKWKNGYLSVQYVNLIAPVIESIKKQQKMINRQQEEIELLKKEIKLLKKK